MSQIVNKTYTDSFGNVVGDFYRSNVLDSQTVLFEVDNVIRMVSSPMNIITSSPVYNQLTSTTTKWLDLGFRVGQTVDINLYDYAGAPFPYGSHVIASISDYTITLDTFPALSDGQQFSTGASSISPGTNYRMEVTSQSYHDGLDFQLNHCLNGSAGNTPSLIDGENTTLRFNGLEALAVSGAISGVQVGNASGQFACSAEIERVTDVFTNVRRYELTLNFINSGALNQDWFIGSACLKPYFKFKFQAVIGEPYGTQDLIDDFSADTGYFDEPYNLGVSNSALVQGIPSIDWYNANLGEFTIDSPVATVFEMGGCYIPLDETYYKNKPLSQSAYCMRLNTGGALVATPHFSASNDTGAQWTLNISTPTIVGTEYTYTWGAYGNTAWQDFFESRDEGDRRFVLYIKAGNTNIVLFDGQMEKQPLPAGVIPDISTAFFLDHAQNITDENGIDLSGGGFAYTEDDIAMVFKFSVLKNSVYNKFNARIEVFNTATNERFTLQETSFDMESAPISTDGKQLINASVNQPNNLPSTSAKKTATFGLESALETPTHYGFKCYYPFVWDWRNWIAQPNANADFYGNQNKRWLNYILPPDWFVVLYFGLETEEQAFEKRYNLPFKDYETGNTTPVIELYRENGDLVTSVVDGEIMTIKAIHTTATTLNIASVWSAMTVEPTESNPRWVCSTVIGNGNDVNNPLSDISVQVIGLNTIVSCKFDTNKLNLENGVSFGNRIDGNDIFGSFLLQENLDYILQEDTDKIIIE